MHAIGQTIVHQENCHLFCDFTRCSPCAKQRSVLNARRCRKRNSSSKSIDPSSTTPYCMLSKDDRLKLMHDKFRVIKKQRDRLAAGLSAILEDQSLQLNAKDDEDMKSIILEAEQQNMTDKENLSMFQRLFWQQQTEAAKQKDSRGMRWHPLMIRWCIVSNYVINPSMRTSHSDSAFNYRPKGH